MYGAGARALQDEFDSRRLADRLHELTVHTELTDDDTALIVEQSTAWLATVDADGWPDVSYKGGDVGRIGGDRRRSVQSKTPRSGAVDEQQGDPAGVDDVAQRAHHPVAVVGGHPQLRR